MLALLTRTSLSIQPAGSKAVCMPALDIEPVRFVEEGHLTDRRVQLSRGSMLICLCATAVLSIFALWIAHLVLMNYEARAEEAAAAG